MGNSHLPRSTDHSAVLYAVCALCGMSISAAHTPPMLRLGFNDLCNVSIGELGVPLGAVESCTFQCCLRKILDDLRPYISSYICEPRCCCARRMDDIVNSLSIRSYRVAFFALGWPPGTWRDLGCYLYITLRRYLVYPTHPTPPGLAELR